MTATPIPRRCTWHFLVCATSRIWKRHQDRLAVETRVGRWDEVDSPRGDARAEPGARFISFTTASTISSWWLNGVESFPRRTGYRTRPDARGRTRAGDARLHRSASTTSSWRPRSSRRLNIPNEHNLHRRGGCMAGRPAPASRPCRALQAPSVLLSLGGREQVSFRQLRPPATRDRRIQRYGRRLRDRDARPGNRGAGSILGTLARRPHRRSATNFIASCSNRPCTLKHLPPRLWSMYTSTCRAAYLPRTYVPDMRAKVDLYRRLSRVSSFEEVADLASEMTDRFGRIRRRSRLLTLAELRIAAAFWRIESIQRG